MDPLLEKMIGHLERANKLQSEIELHGLREALHRLQHWQCQRLLASHAELWEQKRFKPAIQFFIDELYGPKDFSQRDEDIARVVPKMARILPQKALESLESALYLNTLSLELDHALLEQLDGRTPDRDSYAEAYRNCDNLASRKLQIDLIEVLGMELADVVKIKGISTLLMLSRKPAKLAGVLSLHEFIETGFKAFKKLGEVSEFINPIVAGERALMQALFDHQQPNPIPEINP